MLANGGGMFWCGVVAGPVDNVAFAQPALPGFVCTSSGFVLCGAELMVVGLRLWWHAVPVPLLPPFACTLRG